MNAIDFTTHLLVEQTPAEVFAAINNVRGWWIDEIEGASAALDDEFAVRFEDIHYSRQKLAEFVPGAKIVWLVTDSRLNFLKDKTEWNGTKIVFEISRHDNKTDLSFTHQGLLPQIECYSECSNAWQGFITKSLFSLITTGQGQPYHPKKMANTNSNKN